MSEKVSDNEVSRTIVKCVTAVLIVVFGTATLVHVVGTKSEERIKLAKIAAATSQYCDCLKLIEVE